MAYTASLPNAPMPNDIFVSHDNFSLLPMLIPPSVKFLLIISTVQLSFLAVLCLHYTFWQEIYHYFHK
jgi:hypothetical protein